MTIMSRALVTIGLFGSGCAATGANSDQIAMIKRMESRIILPAEASSLEDYNRFYYVRANQIEGVFIFSGHRRGRISIVAQPELPIERRDGGCSVIRLTYDRSEERWTSVVCNQRA